MNDINIYHLLPYRTIPKTRKGPQQAERIPYFHNADHHRKADGTNHGQEVCSGLRKEKPSSPQTKEDIEQKKKTKTPGKTQPDLHTMSMKDSRGKNKLWPWRSIWNIRTTECNSADGTHCAKWHQLDAEKMTWGSTPGKKGCYATWKLNLHAPTTDNGISTRLSPVPRPLQCLHKGTGRSKQQWFKSGTHACRQRIYLQSSQ